MILNEDAVFSKSCKNPVYIVLMNGKSPLSSIILKATGDYFSHACIAFNDDLDPLYSFGAKSKTMQKGGMGFCISKPTDLSVFNKQAYYAVYVTYVTDEAYAKMKERLSYFTTNANKMIYDYVGLLNVWMHQSSDNRTRAYFCSRFVMDIIGAGIKLDKLPSLYRPQDIASMNNISLVNRGFDFHNYDKKITQKNEKLLKQGKLNPDDIIFEDVSSVIQKDFKSKHDMNLSQFEKMRLSDAAIQVYKQKLPSLSHVRINNNTKGYIWIDKKTDMPAAIVNVEEKDDGFTWIQAFEIFVPYKGHGLSKDILNVAIRELKATNLSVNKDNQVAIKVYKSYGFKTYKTTEYMYFMSIDKNAFDDDDDEDIYDESTIMESVSPKIYFLSESNMDGKTLLPRIPSNYMTKNGYEESKTPRVCFSTSIDGSLMGLSQNLKGKELYVHIPESEVNIYKPSVKQVPDCKITGEVWVKDKVNIKCIGKIKVIKDKGLPGHRYMYGDGKSAELYDWDWKWEKKYLINESAIIESYNPHYTYSKLSSQKEISDFKNSMKIVFNSNDKPTDKLIKSMKKIEDNGTVIGYIGFSSYKIDGKKYLGIVNFMVLPQYQSKGYGANIITDIININKNKYDEIYCYVEESNTRAISFYKRVGKVGNLTDYGYYVTLYSSKSHVNESTIEDFEIEAETGFYDKHNRWNPIVIINGEQYRHRVECLIMRQNKLFVAKSNTGVLLIPGGGVDKSLSDEEQVYNECKEEARILVENIKPTGYAYLRRTGVSESAKRLPKEQQWVGSYTEIYIADYAKDFTGFIDYCDRDSEMIRGNFRPISEIIDKLVPEWKLALIDANYISVATEALKSYKDPKLALKRRIGIKRNNAVKLGDFSNVAKSAPTPQAQTISVPSPAVSSSAPPPAKPAQTTEETKEIPETVKANANRLLCKEIASYPKFSGCYYNMDYPLYNGNGHAIVGWKMTGVHYNDFNLFNKYRDRIYEYCSKIFEDTNPGYGLKMDKKTNCIYITEI